jgi:RNA polymerase sigma factor (TIGR02999 family)
MSADAISELLARWGSGEREALDQLTPLIYDELRKIAARHLRREREGHTLQTTALAHEAFLKLANQPGLDWQNRAHFFAIAARLVRQILVDYARAGRRVKRGGGLKTLVLDETLAPADRRSVELIALNDALDGLARLDQQQSRVVELRFFGGLSVEETAAVLQVSRATVNRDWVTARAWLLRELGGGPNSS